MKKKPKHSESSFLYSSIKFFAGIVKEIGLHGFLVIIGVFVFLAFGSDNQKKEFIDTFILFKHTDENPFPCVFIIASLFLVIIFGSIYSNKMLLLRKQENNRTGKEKSELQQLLLNKKLKSSDN